MRARTEATEIIPLDKEEVGCRSKSLKNDVEKSGPSPSRGLDLNVPQNVCHMPKKNGLPIYITGVQHGKRTCTLLNNFLNIYSTVLRVMCKVNLMCSALLHLT
jgi:hypothetical protein